MELTSTSESSTPVPSTSTETAAVPKNLPVVQVLKSRYLLKHKQLFLHPCFDFQEKPGPKSSKAKKASTKVEPAEDPYDFEDSQE